MMRSRWNDSAKNISLRWFSPPKSRPSPSPQTKIKNLDNPSPYTSFLASAVLMCVKGINSRRFTSTSSLTIDTINPNLRNLDFDVNQKILSRMKNIEQAATKPFKAFTELHLGDLHAQGQQHMTFVRQVLALVSYPHLLGGSMFPEDAKDRAKDMLEGWKGSSNSALGIRKAREQVATFIEERDAQESYWEDVVLCAGTSSGIRSILQLFACHANGKKPGVMIPVPRCPLYSSAATELGIETIEYHLEETNKWSVALRELVRSHEEASKKCTPRAIIVVNPGNPTGQVLTKENIEVIIKFAYDNNLFILADEVYQNNIYGDGVEFHSFKKILIEMGSSFNSVVELASFNSASAGYTSEIGLRSGYIEILNMHPDCKAIYFKTFPDDFSSTLPAQVITYCMVNPPKKGQPSYEPYLSEKFKILHSLKISAALATDTFNMLRGFSCNPIDGSVYAFPQIRLPNNTLKVGMDDIFYSSELLKSTGVVVVPGTELGQKPETFHIRITLSPQPIKFKRALQRLFYFHEEFMKKYE